MDEKIKNGAFQIARQLFDSELWIEKPSSWKIIWIYILGKVNHQDNKQFERGEGFFNFSQELKQIGRDITYDMIRHSMTYFKRNGMLSTTKSTRGIIVKVLKYNKFQKLENYKSTTASTTKAQPKHNESTTINKNVKNANNVKNVSTKEIYKEKYLDEVFLTKQEYQKLVDKFGETLTKDYIQRLDNYMGSKGKRYKSHYKTILMWDDKNKPQQTKKGELEEL